MWSLSILTTFLAISHIALANKHHTTKPCPTVTSTVTVCSTCITPDCIVLSTISAQRHCPHRVPTVRKSFPCSKSKCPGCSTEYVHASSYGPTKTKPVCPTVTSRGTVCSTCITPLCLTLSTVSSVCGCPKTAATITTNYPCGKGCPAGCGTEYVAPTVTPNCKKGKGWD